MPYGHLCICVLISIVDQMASSAQFFLGASDFLMRGHGAVSPSICRIALWGLDMQHLITLKVMELLVESPGQMPHMFAPDVIVHARLATLHPLRLFAVCWKFISGDIWPSQTAPDWTRAVSELCLTMRS